MPKLTKQGLIASMHTAVEFGYKACERGDNLTKAAFGAAKFIDELAERCDNLPSEFLSFTAKGGKLKQVDPNPRKR